MYLYGLFQQVLTRLDGIQLPQNKESHFILDGLEHQVITSISMTLNKHFIRFLTSFPKQNFSLLQSVDLIFYIYQKKIFILFVGQKQMKFKQYNK